MEWTCGATAIRNEWQAWRQHSKAQDLLARLGFEAQWQRAAQAAPPLGRAGLLDLMDRDRFRPSAAVSGIFHSDLMSS